MKRAQSGPESASWAFRNSRFTARHVTLRSLIQTAYGKPEQVLTARQIVGAPAWSEQERFDIEATAPGTPDSARGTFSSSVLAMLRNLLEERFSLRAHFETRDFPLFALVRAKEDGSLGSGLQRRTTDCIRAAPGAAAGADGQTCGGQIIPGVLVGAGLTMTNLVSGLARFAPEVDRVIVDRTGLTGTFNINLRWRPDTPPPGQGGAPTGAADSNLPSLFTALEEQLGLKLERTNGPLEILVIDDVQPPVPN